MARQLGIVNAFGTTRQGKLGLWQVIARVIDQGSRLSAVRLAGNHAACDVLGLGKFNGDDLYNNLDWLCEKQANIEDRLFKKTHRLQKPGLYLYDVTSSYFEGYAYGKSGKYKEAITALNQALRVNPDYADAHYNLGFAYLMLNDKNSAIGEYKILKNLDPEFADKLFKEIHE